MIAVLDASVALKWQFQEEEATEPATALLEDYVEGKIELITITLFPYEIISDIHVAVNRKRISERDGYQSIRYLTSLGIELRPFDNLIDATFLLARKYQLSPYDCAYLALAEKEKCEFITGDRKLLHAGRVSPPRIRWIGDYRS